MSTPLQLGSPHHIRLTVTDVPRSQQFYTDVFGFTVAISEPPADDPDGVVADTLQGGILMAMGTTMLGLRPVDEAHQGDRFDPFRVGLDHLCYSVADRAALDTALAHFDRLGVSHGPIREVAALGMAFLAAFDPDGIAIELAAPL